MVFQAIMRNAFFRIFTAGDFPGELVSNKDMTDYTKAGLKKALPP